MMTDPISDMLTRIRNASLASKSVAEMPLSKMKYAIAKILEHEGYVGAVEQYQEGARPMLRINLKYDGAAKPAISSIKRISKPGRRVYAKSNELPRVRGGYGFALVSTPNGIMTSDEARKRHLGGEIICEVF